MPATQLPNKSSEEDPMPKRNYIINLLGANDPIVREAETCTPYLEVPDMLWIGDLKGERGILINSKLVALIQVEPTVKGGTQHVSLH